MATTNHHRPVRDGYQLIEPAPLADLQANARVGGGAAVALAVLAWLVAAVPDELGEKLAVAELHVIRAEYHGAYPTIAIRYEALDAPDLGPLVEEAITRILRDRAAIDFVAFVSKSSRNWSCEAEDLLAPAPSTDGASRSL